MTTVVLYSTLLGIAAVSTSWTCKRYPELRGLVPWLVTVLTSALILVKLLDRPFGGAKDELVYQRQANSVWSSLLLSGHFNDDLVQLDKGKEGWPTILGLAYRWVGDNNPYVGICINLLIAYLALLLTAAAGCRIWGPRKWTWWMGPIFTLSPVALISMPSILREVWVWLALAITVHGLVSVVRRRRLHGFLLIALGCAIAYWIRQPMAAIFGGAIAAALVANAIWRRWGNLAAVVGLAAMFAVGQRLVAYSLQFVGRTVDSLMASRTELTATATTGFAAGDPLTPAGLAKSMLHTTIGPFPWEYHASLVWGWVFVNWAFWVGILVTVVVALRRSRLTGVTFALLVFAAIVLVGLAISLTNYGIVVRMRATVIFALMPITWGLLPRSTIHDGTLAAHQDARVVKVDP